MTKSHVSMEQHVCMVCAHPFDTGAILLDRRLRQSLEPKTVTQWGLCPEHEGLYKQDFIALVEIDPAKVEHRNPGPGDVYRTGRVMHIKERAFKQLMNVPSRNAKGKLHPVMWIDPEAFDRIAAMQHPEDRK